MADGSDRGSTRVAEAAQRVVQVGLGVVEPGGGDVGTGGGAVGAPDGTGTKDWVGTRVWLVSGDESLDPWLLGDAVSAGPIRTGVVELCRLRPARFAGPPAGWSVGLVTWVGVLADAGDAAFAPVGSQPGSASCGGIGDGHRSGR